MALHGRSFTQMTLMVALGAVLSASCATAPESGEGKLHRLVDAGVDVEETHKVWTDEDERRQRVETLLASPLQMDEAVEVGLLNNPGLQAALGRVEIQEGRLRQEAAIANPEFHSEFYVFGEQWELSRVETSLEFDLTSLLARSSRLRAATWGVDRARSRAAGEVIDFTTELRRAWIEQVAARQLLERQQLLYEAARAAADSARAYHDAGNMADDELYEVLAVAAEARRELFDAEDAFYEHREKLGLLLGLSPDEEWSLPSELDEPPEEMAPTEALQERALDQNLGLRQLALAEEHQRALVTTSRWEGFVPTLRLGVVSDWRRGDLEVGPTMGLAIPVFDRRRRERDALRARGVQLDFERRQLANQVRMASARADRRLRQTHRLARHYIEEVLPLREALVEQSLQQYNAMTIGVFDLLDARRTHLRTERDYIETLRDFWLARVDVEHLMAGGTLDGDVPPADGVD